MANDKVITINDRIPKLKEQRRQRTNRRLIFYLSIFFLLILIVVYFQSSLSHIRSIEVTGHYYVNDELIIAESGLAEGTSIWNVDRSVVATTLEALDEIKEATVYRRFPNKIEIEVLEYPRVAYLMDEGKYYPIIETGTFLDEMDRNYLPVDAPILVNWEQGEEVQELAAELIKLPEALIHRISEIYHTPTENDPLRMTLFMNDGFEVQSTIRQFSDKFTAYPSIVEEIDPEAEGIIHLRMTPYFEEFERVVDEEEVEIEGER
ncbi:cell division protein FtsQ/DivIB [Desertibacillus haloalkaliphilus]|uniref:cell division protein FtsQ/DivIB n=1 Tax=Desertibacillus haloalkaliphilus TaxID=1328930 RepID=UPI001C27A628|nr:FtsQ-type POTRA domain-containing protein [Desertibacillus haloalkaliphilus]MBU8907107.1 FtsQ-type POTRA domain-containing protein [Desertibacillus haloalkaliphilus]